MRDPRENVLIELPQERDKYGAGDAFLAESVAMSHVRYSPIRGQILDLLGFGRAEPVRIFCHAQHLSGVGHFVRMRAIARGLRPAHDVVLVHGGRPMPGGDVAGDPEAVTLPQLFSSGGPTLALPEVRQARRACSRSGRGCSPRRWSGSAPTSS